VTGMSLSVTIRFKNVWPAKRETIPTATSRPKGSLVGGDFNPRGEENEVAAEQYKRAQKSELLADEGEDHVVVGFGDMGADGDIQCAAAGELAGAESDFRLCCWNPAP
jgi:hypothetical protein